ncbi:DUF1684 domain-containing protein [Microbacterium sp. SS28]|uniref:DUF1684 domain-containing protein n=1 Tax=Microbacterium sp. SS28 TaxID=2919948 RepID=UPI001FAAB06D|nr:DUF1684 domain-containing protein [Microbacterium sp. SS28]
MSTQAIDPAVTDRVVFGREWEEWHRAHEARRADPHGFLAVTGLYWLSAEPQRIPGLPGEWTTGAEGPVVDLAPDEALEVGDATVTGRHAFGVIAERGGVTARFGGDLIEIAKRGGHDIVRPRHPEHPFLAAYAGTPTYVPNPRWRAKARYVPYAEPRPTEVGAAVDGLTHVYDAPGELEFTLGGEDFRLVAFPGHGADELLVLFTDATSGITTYAANRSLGVAAPDAEGFTVLDFNRAVNLPCAYTDFATCPLPPEGNRLPIGIEAGEKTPLSRVVAAPGPSA